MTTVCLSFELDVDDDWPPVAVESLQLRSGQDGYEVLSCPLFVKDVSVGDLIAVALEPGTDKIESWWHLKRSRSTTIWLLRMAQTPTIEGALSALRELGCNTSALEHLGAYSVDVPPSVAMDDVDTALSALESESVAVAFPSMRHQE